MVQHPLEAVPGCCFYTHKLLIIAGTISPTTDDEVVPVAISVVLHKIVGVKHLIHSVQDVGTVREQLVDYLEGRFKEVCGVIDPVHAKEHLPILGLSFPELCGVDHRRQLLQHMFHTLLCQCTSLASQQPLGIGDGSRPLEHLCILLGFGIKWHNSSSSLAELEQLQGVQCHLQIEDQVELDQIKWPLHTQRFLYAKKLRLLTQVCCLSGSVAHTDCLAPDVVEHQVFHRAIITKLDQRVGWLQHVPHYASLQGVRQLGLE